MPGSPTTVKSVEVGAQAAHTRERLAEQPEFVGLPTNGIVRRAERVVRPRTGTATSSSSKPFATTVRAVPERDRGLGERPSHLADEHLARLRRRLQARRRVDHRPVVRSCADGPTPVAASPDSTPTWTSSGRSRPSSSLSLRSLPPDRQPCADRPDGIVLVGLRQPEDRHHGVADELLGLAAERVELLGRRVVEPPRGPRGPAGIEPSREPGGVHQIGEQHRDHPAFFGRQGRAERRPAVRTELRPLGSVGAADRSAFMAVKDRPPR